MSYSLYLKSEHWKKTRVRFLKSKRFKGFCFICEEVPSFYEIHHKTYKRLGREHLHNLVALCSSCHYAVHHKDGIKLPLNGETLNGRVYLLRKTLKNLK